MRTAYSTGNSTYLMLCEDLDEKEVKKQGNIYTHLVIFLSAQ